MTRHCESPPRRRRGRSKRIAIRKTLATVIGMGGVGRQVAMHLTALGVGRLQLVDARTVSIRTHARQGYALEDVGQPRVFAAAQRCHPINPQLDLQTVSTRSLRGLDLGDAVFLCPGEIAATDAVAKSIGDTIAFVARCTVARSTIRVDIAWDRCSLARWPKAAETARLATALSMPAESMAAGMAVAEFVRFVGGRRPRSLRLNLFTLKLDIVG